MNIFEIQGTRDFAPDRRGHKFAQLTGGDLQFTESKEGELGELIGRIQKHTGKAKSDISRAAGECCAVKSGNQNRGGERT